MKNQFMRQIELRRHLDSQSNLTPSVAAIRAVASTSCVDASLKPTLAAYTLEADFWVTYHRICICLFVVSTAHNARRLQCLLSLTVFRKALADVAANTEVRRDFGPRVDLLYCSSLRRRSMALPAPFSHKVLPLVCVIVVT
ncbi:Cellulose synthase catalytic subunit [Pseudozyma hubeiensis]|nr:Cellulose synthase catalytic subunit [Pseudozyma hubeiensis]